MQSDLFNLSISNSFERQAFQRSFFEKKYTLRLDQLLGLSLVTIVFFVLVFAWGVERGKADSRREFMVQNQSATEKSTQAGGQTQIAAQLTESVSPVVTAPAVEIMAENQAEISTSVPSATAASLSPGKMKYTIAHITYVKKSQALSEIERIKSRGYEPFLVPSGKYYQICVNGFESRKNANETIKSLRLKGIVSADSYIRNMPSIG